MRVCKKCSTTQPLEEFYKTTHGRRWECRTCIKARTAKRYAANREKIASQTRAWRLRRNFGLEPGEFERILDTQGGRCAICKTDKSGGSGTWHVDHNHDTSQVRGLLCMKCNHRLGTIEDRPWMEAASAYLALRHS